MGAQGVAGDQVGGSRFAARTDVNGLERWAGHGLDGGDRLVARQLNVVETTRVSGVMDILKRRIDEDANGRPAREFGPECLDDARRIGWRDVALARASRR